MSRLDFPGKLPEDPNELRRALERAFLSIRNVLEAARGGIRAREQLRVIDVEIDTGALPASVTIDGLTRPPLAVLLLRAVKKRTADGQTTSGTGLLWSWRGGALVIHGADVLDANTRYDCAIAVLEG